MFTAQATGTDGRTYSARAGSRLAALHALAIILPNGVQILTHTLEVAA